MSVPVFSDMVCGGVSVDGDSLGRAFGRWASETAPRSYSRLAALIAFQADFGDQEWPGHRHADRLLQKLRARGYVAHKRGKGWYLTDKGENLAGHWQ